VEVKTIFNTKKKNIGANKIWRHVHWLVWLSKYGALWLHC
jgi:hypothetical protein